MQIHVHGDSVSAKVFKHTSAIHGEVLEFTPERGMVSIRAVDALGEDYKRVSTREFLCRTKALALEIPKIPYSDEKRDQLRLVEQMFRVIKACRDQGDPFLLMVSSALFNAPKRSSALMGGVSYDPGMPPMPGLDLAKAASPLVAATPVSKLILPGR
jgi:hypothetical protein